MASKREWLLVVPLLSLLLVIPFWQVATMQGIVITNDIAVSDMANLHHPVRHFLGSELREGRLPLWLPDVYMGYPIQAEGMMGAFYPPNLLLFGLLPPLPALNLSVLWPFFMAAFATYALARKLGAAIWPSLVAAVAYALGGYYIVHLKHLPIVHTASWIPLVWLVIEWGLEGKRRYLLLAGVIWAIQWLAGSPQLAYYSAGAGLVYYLGRAIQTRQLRKTAPLMALAVVLSFGLAAVQIWPTVELTGSSERAGGVSFDFASSFGYQLASLRTFLYPYANGDPGTASYQIKGLFWEDYAYIGLLPLFAGLVGGLWLARKSGLARLLLLLAGAAFVVGLGENTHDLSPGLHLDPWHGPVSLPAASPGGGDTLSGADCRPELDPLSELVGPNRSLEDLEFPRFPAFPVWYDPARDRDAIPGCRRSLLLSYPPKCHRGCPDLVRSAPDRTAHPAARHRALQGL